MGGKSRRCPACGSTKTVEIVYGMPSYNLYLEEKAGKIKLGGCCIDETSPAYYCKDCGCEFGTLLGNPIRELEK